MRFLSAFITSSPGNVDIMNSYIFSTSIPGYFMGILVASQIIGEKRRGTDWPTRIALQAGFISAFFGANSNTSNADLYLWPSCQLFRPISYRAHLTSAHTQNPRNSDKGTIHCPALERDRTNITEASYQPAETLRQHHTIQPYHTDTNEQPCVYWPAILCARRPLNEAEKNRQWVDCLAPYCPI